MWSILNTFILGKLSSRHIYLMNTIPWYIPEQPVLITKLCTNPQIKSLNSPHSIVWSSWNLPDGSAVSLQSHLPNFRMIRHRWNGYLDNSWRVKIWYNHIFALVLPPADYTGAMVNMWHTNILHTSIGDIMMDMIADNIDLNSSNNINQYWSNKHLLCMISFYILTHWCPNKMTDVLQRFSVKFVSNYESFQ